MRKLVIFIIATIVSANCLAQSTSVKTAEWKNPKDTVHVKDTVRVPVYLVDVTDTVQASITYEKKKGSGRVYITKGFALLRGFKVFDKEPKWVDKPALVGALDEKKRPIKNVVQVF